MQQFAVRAVGKFVGMCRRVSHWTKAETELRLEEAVARHLEPVQLSELLRQVPGQWLALRNGDIIEARPTLDELLFRLHDRNITDATVMRAPAENEAEMVGLG